MITSGSISSQLKERRLSLELSLAEVARRADTSAATLSRYENGWTRFELYTLRKLATALGCELQVGLVPFGQRDEPIDGSEAVKRLGRLFWDRPLVERDLRDYPHWVVQRVVEYGDLQDVLLLQRFLGRRAFLETVAEAAGLSRRARALWDHVLRKEGMECTRGSSPDTPWIC